MFRPPGSTISFFFCAALIACVEVAPEEPGESGSAEQAESLAGSAGILGEPAASEPGSLSCEGVDEELGGNCDIALPCASFTEEQHACVAEVMSIDWFRPPCEEYAACLGLPLFSCEDTDAELSLNCGIDDPSCSEMSWDERFCLSANMAIDWAQPPCEEYATCLGLPLFGCGDIESELDLNCDIEVTCSLLDFSERFCLSELMSILWSSPPCGLYGDCIGL